MIRILTTVYHKTLGRDNGIKSFLKMFEDQCNMRPSPSMEHPLLQVYTRDHLFLVMSLLFLCRNRLFLCSDCFVKFNFKRKCKQLSRFLQFLCAKVSILKRTRPPSNLFICDFCVLLCINIHLQHKHRRKCTNRSMKIQLPA